MSTEAIVQGLGNLPEIQMVPVFSTAHITKKDDELLRGYESDMPKVAVTDFGYGYEIHLFGGGIFELESKGFSDAFLNIFNLLCNAGYDYVKFDCDGPVIENLKTFKW